MIIQAIKCDRCGRLHNADEDTFFTVRGNIMMGLQGGLVGNNLDNDSKVTREQMFCRDSCMADVLMLNPKTTRTAEVVTVDEVRQGGHAESCPSIAFPGSKAFCTCSGGNYVMGRRGPRQLGEYDG